MKILSKLQYISLYVLSLIIIGATSLLTGDVGFDALKGPTYYINQLLIDAAIMCVTFATLYAYIDNFKSTNQEYLESCLFISNFATSKNNVPSILSLFLERFNHTRKVKQFTYNKMKKICNLENKRRFLIGRRVFKESDYYIWNHGTPEEKKKNAYCNKRQLLEEQLTQEYIDKNIDTTIVKYDKITISIILGGYYQSSENSSPNEFITKNPNGKIVKYKAPKLLYSFAMMFVLSSIVFDNFSFNTDTILQLSIKIFTLLWNCYTTLRYANTYCQSVIIKDIRFRKGLIVEYNKWLEQEANKKISAKEALQ